jgi:hypothetical protein
MWLRRHLLAVVVALMAVASLALFTWAEYGYFCDQGRDHGDKVCQGFWSAEHLHDWLYNAAANWQSELLFGVLLVIVLHGLAHRDPATADEET